MMNFNYNLALRINLFNIPFKLNTKFMEKNSVNLKTDSFVTNPIYSKFDTKEMIEKIAVTNSRIQELLKENNLTLTINDMELENLKRGHLNDTRLIVSKIYSFLPEIIKQRVDIVHLQEAALLHDYGKVLIPSKILNKKGKLTADELKIMELHSELGYELLKSKNLSEKTLNLIKYHHQNLKGNGYPRIDRNINYSIENQILSIADKYSALREKRCYKNALAKYEALEIIAKDVNKGYISQEVYTALIKSV